MRPLLLCLLIVLSTARSFAQQFYTTSGSLIKRVTVTGPSTYKVQDLATCNLAGLYTIAVYKKVMYYSNGFGLYKGDLIGNSVTNCQFVMNVPSSAGLTVNTDGMLYLESNYQLYKIDPVGKTSTNLGRINFTTSGDMVFYKGLLYMASLNGGIARIDITDLSKSKLAIPVSGSLFGMASIAYSSTENKIYAFDNISSGTRVLELDLENDKVVSTAFNLPFSVADAASDVESGGVAEMKIDQIKQSADCPFIGKGTVQVICENALIDYKYTLNGVTNTTGVFTGLDPGTYAISVTSPTQKKDTTFTVSKFTVLKPTITTVKVDPTCSQPGSITMTATPDDNFKVKQGSQLFDLNRKYDLLTPGHYHFDVVNLAGCVVDTIGITLDKKKCEIQYAGMQITQECAMIRKGNIKVLTNTHFDLYTYTLNGTQSNTTGVFSALKPGTYNIRITSSEDQKDLVAVIPDYTLTEPALTTKSTDPYCADKGVVNFTIPVSSAGYQVKYDGVLYPFSKAFDYLTAGKHDFVIYKPSGCVLDSVSVDLTYQPCIIEVESTSVNQECNVLGKGVIQVTGRPIPEQYTYYLNGGSPNSTGRFDMLAPGKYLVKVTASGGNTPKEIELEVPDYDLLRPKYFVSTVDPVCDLLGSIRVAVTTDPALYDIEYKGHTYSYEHTFTDLIPGSYYFRILKKDGCIANELTVKLNLQPCHPLTFPNAFTPNGDGMNDMFRPNQDSRATQYQLSIFNRNGSQLFVSKDIKFGWDGQYQGKPMPVGVYYWVSTYIDNNGKRANQQGQITLLR
ncbi:gliding motility-associated C-terminal domain-containing protein [Mucilaginibacter daejeonensis]|uniref:gliding motility-associated C-terminal domain-containing protein n=1 Tax=Mucilaginibacter daejeonensis TaxID=398049 RepID=UPI001D17B8A7|nr:gliding motility-associated C-terminal domain-containing protein [Mucilaginibacter daejeonensis]UEG54294.1 gliding motility-associated C-terminal domain-containing protein [Mucilaginibacter daejeonensis]